MLMASLGMAYARSQMMPAPLGKQHAGADSAEAVCKRLPTKPTPSLHRTCPFAIYLVRICKWQCEERTRANPPKGAAIPYIAVQ